MLASALEQGTGAWSLLRENKVRILRHSLASCYLCSYKVLTPSLSAQWVTDSETLKPLEGVGGKRRHDARLCANTPDREEIFHPEAACVLEKMPPWGQLQRRQSHGFPHLCVFIRVFPDCSRELKMKFCRSLPSLPTTKSIKNSS